MGSRIMFGGVFEEEDLRHNTNHFQAFNSEDHNGLWSNNGSSYKVAINIINDIIEKG